MVDEVITKQELIDAQKDAQSLDDFINGGDEQIVVTRLLKEYPTLANAIRQIYEKGGKFYPTLADANADIANIRTDVYVITGDNGAYYKATAEATSLTKSPYDPLTQAKEYVAKTGFAKLSAAVITNIDYTTANRTLTFKNTTYITSGTAVYPLTTPVEAEKSVSLPTNAVYRLEYNVLTNTIRAQPHSQGLLDGWITVGIIRVSDTGILTEDFEYSINGVAYSPIDKATKIAALDATNKVIALKSELIVTGTNLYNAATATSGFAILDDGSVSANAAYSYSDYIAVIPNEKYTMTAKDAAGVVQNAFVNVAYYDKDKNFLSRIYTQNKTQPNGVLTITTLANAAFIRLNITDGPANVFNRQLNFGDVALPYEAYYSPRLTGVSLSGDIVEDIAGRLEITKTDNVMLDIPIDGIFSTTQTWPEITNFRYTTAAQVYQMYDDLMALHPEYITKQTLGNDGLGNPIAVYKFTPTKPSSTVSTKYPKVFLTAGIHGFEHVPPLACYLMFEQMCNNWQSDELLEALRFNVDFLIIPVCNPSGWDAYTRTNHNGVDLNRNFPDGWILQGEGTSTYSGPSAASELETQYVMQVFDENPNINIMYDFHNFHGLNDGDPKWNRFMWVPSGSGVYVNHMAQMLISRMTRKWRKDYPTWFPADHDFFAGWTTTDHGAMVQDHAYGRGIRFSATFEVCERWWVNPSAVPYDKEHKKTAVEAITNWLLINLNELKRI